MRSSFNAVFPPMREFPAMNARGPSNPPGDRQRMADAIASLKEGLRDSADPLYDGWKVPRRQANPAATERRPEGASQAAGLDAGHPIAELGEKKEKFIHDGVLIEATAATSLVVGRASVQTDTVRVRVIRYRAFPRWALIVAAALLVFAASLVALRLSLPRASARSTRSVLASEVPALFPVSKHGEATAPPTRSPALEPEAVPPSDAVFAPAGPYAAPGVELAAPGVEPAAPGVEPATEGTSTTEPSPAAAVRPPAPAGRLPNAPPRRRPSTPDFFRDPGF